MPSSFFEKLEGFKKQYQIKLFGGASTFSTEEEKLLELKSVRDIGMKNIPSIKEHLIRNQLLISSEDLGGFSHRRIFFSLWDGEIYVERPEYMIQVFIIDDSAVVRQVLTQILNKDPEIEIIGFASDPIFASEKLSSVWPDVFILDIEMPRMDGVSF